MKIALCLGLVLLFVIYLNPSALRIENDTQEVQYFIAPRGCPETVRHQIDCQFGDDSAPAFELIKNESGFNLYARNPTSGACGLGQALPCSKMKCELEDIKCQVAWVKGYVDRRYGGVRNALAFWHRQSPNWY